MLSIADEIQKLVALRGSGSLSDEEFQQAKQSLLDSESSNSTNTQSVGRAANRFVTFYIVASILGFLIAIGMVAGVCYFTLGWYKQKTDKLINDAKQVRPVMNEVSERMSPISTLRDRQP